MDINLSALPWQPLQAKNCLPKKPGIYFALDPENDPLYIGKSEGLKSRWSGHKQLRHLKLIADVKLAYHLANKEELHNLEAELIEKYDPPLNRYRGRRRPEENTKYSQEKFLRQEQFKDLTLLENLRYLLDAISSIAEIAKELGWKVVNNTATETEIWLFSGFAELSVMGDLLLAFTQEKIPCSRFLFKSQVKYDEIEQYLQAKEIPVPDELAYEIADFLSELSNFQEFSEKFEHLLALDYEMCNCKVMLC